MHDERRGDEQKKEKTATGRRHVFCFCFRKLNDDGPLDYYRGVQRSVGSLLWGVHVRCGLV